MKSIDEIDVYTFECDLDRDIPADQRSGLSIHDDGEHLVFGLSRGGSDSREIYLTPDAAGDLAALLVALTYEEDDEQQSARRYRVFGTVLLVLLLGATLGMMGYAVIALLSN